MLWGQRQQTELKREQFPNTILSAGHWLRPQRTVILEIKGFLEEGVVLLGQGLPLYSRVCKTPRGEKGKRAGFWFLYIYIHTYISDIISDLC